MVLTTIELTEQKDLEFEVSIGGIRNSADSIRFIIEGKDFDYSCKCQQINENTLKVIVPKMEGKLAPGVYGAKMEIVVDGKVFTPFSENIEFVPEPEFTGFRSRVELSDEYDINDEIRESNASKSSITESKTPKKTKKDLSEKFTQLVEGIDTDDALENIRKSGVLKKSENGFIVKKSGDIFILERSDGIAIKAGSKLEVMLEWDTMKHRGEIVGDVALSKATLQDLVEKHNLAVGSLKIGTAKNSGHPDVMLKAPKGYALTESFRLVKDFEIKKKKSRAKSGLVESERTSDDIPGAPNTAAGTKPEKSWIDIAKASITNPANAKKPKPKDKYFLRDEEKEDDSNEKIEVVNPALPKPLPKTADMKQSAEVIKSDKLKVPDYEARSTEVIKTEPKQTKKVTSREAAREMYQKLLDYQSRLDELKKETKK